MFPNCIDRFGRQKKETTKQKANKRKTKKRAKEKKKKMGIIVPTMNHYPANG